jgi:hypothetical protein
MPVQERMFSKENIMHRVQRLLLCLDAHRGEKPLRRCIVHTACESEEMELDIVRFPETELIAMLRHSRLHSLPQQRLKHVRAFSGKRSVRHELFSRYQ